MRTASRSRSRSGEGRAADPRAGAFAHFAPHPGRRAARVAALAAAALALFVSPRAAGAAERLLVVADARLPDAAETAASVARKVGFEVQVAPEGFLLALGCSGGDIACWAKGGAAVGAKWMIVIDVAGTPPPLVAVVRRIAVDIPAEVGAISGPVPPGTEIVALAELVASVVGAPAESAPAPAPPPAGATSGAEGRFGVLVVPAAAATGVTLLAAGAATFFALRLGTLQGEFDRAPNESLEELRALVRLERRGRTAAAVANTSYVVGGVAAAAAVALWAVWLAAGRGPREEAPPVELSGAGLLVRW